MDTKYCRYCQQDKPTADFNKKVGSRDGLEYKCKACVKDYMARRWRNSEEHHQAEIRRAIREARRDLLQQEHQRKIMLIAETASIEASRQIHEARKLAKERVRSTYQRRTEEERASSRDYYKRKYRDLKNAILLKLGGKCYCCGLDDMRFLTIDHIKNDGVIERKPGGKSRNSYTVLRLIWNSPDFFERYRSACYNCNCARHQTPEKRCPHQQ